MQLIPDFEAPSWTLAAPAVKPTVIPLSFLKFPPSSLPTTIPPPPDHPTLAHPFTIPPELYNALLSPAVPITVALVYATIVAYVNSVNAERKWKPWAFSRTRVFRALVIFHNIFLAVYSAWTFIGMFNAVRLSFERLDTQHGLAGMVDSMCKMNGPRGIGSAATFNETTSTWGIKDRALKLAPDGLGPLSTDVGRMWNEGLAFYGWIFYLSKFYEVIDTGIILAKGKRSSLLQTYHHAGAMICMWAGIRYMSPPIWMFVFVNSGIHAIMYTFYLCSALGIRVPKWFKQTLTTLQITQFVVGATYAFLHLFIAYQIPVSVPYLYRLGDAASKIASALPSDASSAASSAVATASAGLGAWLKKAAFRAAGREGLAENVLNERGQTFGVDAVNAAQDFFAREETRFRDELQWVHCLDTSGQTFAILLNCMYLAPLTWLFVQFFITSYLKRLERRRSSAASEKSLIARDSLGDATKGVARRLSEAFQEMHRKQDYFGGDEDAIADGDEVKQELKDAATDAQKKLSQAASKAKEAAKKVDIRQMKDEMLKDLEKLKESVKATGQRVEEQVPQSMSEDVKEKAKETKETAESIVTAKSEPEAEDKSTDDAKPEKRSPNGAGIAVEEASGATQKQAKQDEAEKKEQEKIIDESQLVRDEAVKTKNGKNGSKAAKSNGSKKNKKGEKKAESEEPVPQKDEKGDEKADSEEKVEETAPPKEDDSAETSKVRSDTSFADAVKEE